MIISIRKKQQGVALITVMLIVALAAIIAAQMTTRLQMQMQRSINISFNQQAYWYAMGAEAFSKRILIFSFKDEKKVTHLGQQWAQEATTYPVDFGNISGEITDLQSCLNLNALAAPLDSSGNGAGDGSPTPKLSTNSSNNKVPARLAFEKLLEVLAIEGVGTFEADSMANALTDWLDKDGYITGTGGAEDDDYASREFPYLAANNYLSSISELRLIEHFTPQVISSIKPYVCILEQNNAHKVNINTIAVEQPEFLQALLGSTLDEAQQILSARPEDGFATKEDFYNLPELSKVQLSEEQKESFVVDSEYFKLKASASFNDSYFSLISIMKVRDDQQIQIISRKIGRN